MLGSGTLAHAMPVPSFWEDRTNPTLRFSREMMFLEPSAAWVVSTAAQVVLDEVLGVMCRFFFFLMRSVNHGVFLTGLFECYAKNRKITELEGTLQTSRMFQAQSHQAVRYSSGIGKGNL